MNARQTLTRMSTRVDAGALDADVAFDGILPDRFRTSATRCEPRGDTRTPRSRSPRSRSRRPSAVARAARRAPARLLHPAALLDRARFGRRTRAAARPSSGAALRFFSIGQPLCAGSALAGPGFSGQASSGSGMPSLSVSTSGQPGRFGSGVGPGGVTGQAIVDVGNVVAVLVVLRAAGLERIGVLALRDVLADVLVVADAVAIGVGNRKAVGAACAADRFGLGARRRAAEVIRERPPTAQARPSLLARLSGLTTWP